MNRDVELLKVQILADYYHTQFNLVLSFLLTGVIALAIALMTLVYEGHINLLVYYILLVCIAVPFSYGLRTISKDYSENLDKIDDLLKQVEIGEPLPSLKELKKMNNGKPKPKEKEKN